MRLATWNLLHGMSLRDGGIDPARLREGAKELDADVLGLQEVDRNLPRSAGVDQTAEVADAMGAADWRFVPAVVGEPGVQWRPATEDDERTGEAHYGIGLVSRHPVLSWHTCGCGRPG